MEKFNSIIQNLTVELNSEESIKDGLNDPLSFLKLILYQVEIENTGSELCRETQFL